MGKDSSAPRFRLWDEAAWAYSSWTADWIVVSVLRTGLHTTRNQLFSGRSATRFAWMVTASPNGIMCPTAVEVRPGPPGYGSIFEPSRTSRRQAVGLMGKSPF